MFKIITVLVSFMFVGISASGQEKAIFAGGCFWCMQPPFEKIKGVISVKAGYCSQKVATTTNEKASQGDNGDFESIEVLYDSDKVKYQQLLDAFWKNTDPTDEWGQFEDRGTQYRTAV